MLLITMLWVLVRSIGKISNCWIRDLGINSDDKELSSGLDVISWNFLKKKKKLCSHGTTIVLVWLSFHLFANCSVLQPINVAIVFGIYWSLSWTQIIKSNTE